ncbi:hypothetical protein MGH68_14655 [Erysipelothrix sp. D19-032]
MANQSNLQFNIQSSDHTIAAQAIFLGMIANIDLMLESIGFDHNHAIFLTGGFLKNSRMAQRVADLLNVTLLYLEDENSVCEAVSITFRRNITNQTNYKNYTTLHASITPSAKTIHYARILRRRDVSIYAKYIHNS